MSNSPGSARRPPGRAKYWQVHYHWKWCAEYICIVFNDALTVGGSVCSIFVLPTFVIVFFFVTKTTTCCMIIFHSLLVSYACYNVPDYCLNIIEWLGSMVRWLLWRFKGPDGANIHVIERCLYIQECHLIQDRLKGLVVYDPWIIVTVLHSCIKTSLLRIFY